MNPFTHSTPPEPPRFQPRLLRCVSAIAMAIMALTLVCGARGATRPHSPIWVHAHGSATLTLRPACTTLHPRRPFPLTAARIRSLFPRVAIHPHLASAPFAVSRFLFQPFHFVLDSPPPGSRLLAAGFVVPSRQSLASDVIHRHAAGATNSNGWGIPASWLAAVAVTLAVVGTVLTFVAAR